MNIAIIGSTNGSVLRKILEIEYIKQRIVHVFVDRQCGLIQLAKEHDIKVSIVEEKDSLSFSNYLCDYCSIDSFDLVISFYTKLFKGQILNRLKHRLINLHPSILPSFPGMHGFEDTVNSGCLFFGSTIHFVDEGMDTGKPIIQTSRPYNYYINTSENRNMLFQDQCRSLVQVICWFDKSRIKINDTRIEIDSASFEMSVFSPNLDCLEAQKLKF